MRLVFRLALLLVDASTVVLTVPLDETGFLDSLPRVSLALSLSSDAPLVSFTCLILLRVRASVCRGFLDDDAIDLRLVRREDTVMSDDRLLDGRVVLLRVVDILDDSWCRCWCTSTCLGVFCDS